MQVMLYEASLVDCALMQHNNNGLEQLSVENLKPNVSKRLIKSKVLHYY